VNWLKSQGIEATYYHTACSAAALMYPETRMNMVRIGIAQYGFWPSKETKIYKLLSDVGTYRRNPLKRVLTWKSKIAGIKSVQPGEFIGYGIAYQATRVTTIATVPVGYFHGYRRSLSNVGHVLIKGKKAPIIGLVNMSIMIVDISNIHDVEKWEEVVLIGRQGNAEITVSSFSEQMYLVNYELLVRLPSQIPRIVVS
jgi:alanine racemase